MSPYPPTNFRRVVRTDDLENGSREGEQTAGPWSSAPERLLLANLNMRSQVSIAAERSPVPNTEESETFEPKTLNVPEPKPVSARLPTLGKRRFVPSYQWEGVVEEVNGEGFRARLLPVEDGERDAAHIEFADFEYDDLADEDDLGQVAEGAVFYWTVGKSRNAAGTIMNTSLVRFRRLRARPHQGCDAAREAAALLADLGEQ